MPREGWISISLPEEMVNRIKRIIEKKPELGYKSVSDFTVSAVRVYIDYKKGPPEKEET